MNECSDHGPTCPATAEAARANALAHPYLVGLYPTWAHDVEPLIVGFQTEAEARDFASMRPEPIIYLIDRAASRIIGSRVQQFGVDDFPDQRV